MTSPGLFINGYIPAEYSSALTTVNANDVPFWRSVSRPMNSTTWEILKINFRQAVLITDINFDTLKISHQYQLYYTNRSGNLIPVINSDNSLTQGTINTGTDFLNNSSALVDVATKDSPWQGLSFKLYPIVAKSLEIRMLRTPDSLLTKDSTYRLGIRKLILKRTIATEQNKYLGITDTIDAVGNYVSKTFLDWEPAKAIDGTDSTFWKSSPQPDPNAVVSYYLDVRTATGDSSAVDKVWLDPVYTGQQLNVYYSNDDTEGLPTLSTVALSPTVSTNVTWQADVGTILTTVGADLEYSGAALKMVPGENRWIALAFNFAFDSSATVGANLNLFVWDNQSIVYTDATKKITFACGNLSATTPALSWSAGDRIIVIFQIRSLTDPTPGIEGYVYHSGAQAAHVSANGDHGTTNYSNPVKFAYSDGYLTQVLIKRGTYTATDLTQFVASPNTYVAPDPVVMNLDTVVSTTLDNAVLGGDFQASPLLFGGTSVHRFTDKVWSPVWANYTSQKGFLIFPQMLDVKYLKLEFTNLTPEPYPVVDPSLQVSYRTFPIRLSQDTTFTDNKYTATSLDSRMGVETQVDPNAVADKYGLQYGPLDTTSVKDVQITVGDATYSNFVPHTFDTPVTTVTNVEPASSQTLLNAVTPSSMIVSQARSIPVVSGDTIIGLAARYGLDWHTIIDLNSTLLTDNLNRAVAAGYPRHTLGWWIFPGQQLRISTSQTVEWTNTTTVTEATTNTTVTNKFTITAVHKYDIKTVTRDAAIAYFAGIKEVNVWTEDLTQASDSAVFQDSQFQITDGSSYSLNNATIMHSNSVTNLIKNPNFEVGLHSYNDASAVIGTGTYDALTSFVLSNDFAYSGTLSCKLTYGTSTGKNQGLLVRLNELPANAYVGYTWQYYTVASGVWTRKTAVVQADGKGQADLPMVTSSAPTGGTVAYIDGVGAYIVAAANSTVPNFFDGNFSRSQWNGFSGQSSSITSLPTTPAGYYTTVMASNRYGRTTINAPYTTGFESGVAGWTPTNGTFVASTAHSHTGTTAGLFTVTGTPASASVSSPAQPAVATATYVGSCWVYSTDASPASMAVNIAWFDASSTLISTSTGTAAAPVSGVWTQKTIIATAPANAVTATIIPIMPSSPATSATMYVDDVSLGGRGDIAAQTNLVTNPSFETNTTSWASGGTGYAAVTSIAQSTTHAFVNTNSLLVTWATFASKQGVTYNLSGLTNGQAYVAHAMVWNKTGNTTECQLECGGSVGYTSNTLLRNGWQRLQVRWVQSGTTAILALASGATTNGDQTWLDAVTVYAIPTQYTQAPDYLDGSMFGDSWSGTANASTSLSPTKAIVVSPAWKTWSQFRKITATLLAKPLDTILSGIAGATALGVGTVSLATWEDPLATWSDASASWGAASALASINFTSDYIYNGIHSIWMHRSSSGIGGVFSAPITPMVGAHVRAEITVFLPSSLNVTSLVKIVDFATKNTIYLQETITSPRGGWQTYVTNFIISDGTQICIDIESNGSVASDLYIADMSLKMTTITMFASNDNFNTKLDLDNLVWKTSNINGVFPNSGNQLQVRFEMLRVGDWISNFTVTPYYLS